MDELRNWAERETRNARDNASKKEMELLQKTSTMGALESKVRMLEEQLTKKSQQSEKVSQ